MIELYFSVDVQHYDLKNYNNCQILITFLSFSSSPICMLIFGWVKAQTFNLLRIVIGNLH